MRHPGRKIERMVAAALVGDPPVVPPSAPGPDRLGMFVKRLEAHNVPWTLQRVRRYDYEARTAAGVVGRGETASQALAEMLAQLGEPMLAAVA